MTQRGGEAIVQLGWSQGFRRWWTGPPVVVVSGLPRSGTSMMMRMLEAGGVPALCDAARPPDADNPFGYYEDQRVMELGSSADRRWVREARGRALKVISHLLPHLPTGNLYDVILMRRELGEVIASQNRMLARRGEPNPLDDDATRERFAHHLEGIQRMLATAPRFRCIEVSFSEALREPRALAERLARHLDRDLDLDAMSQVVDPAVPRSRAPAPASTAAGTRS